MKFSGANLALSLSFAAALAFSPITAMGMGHESMDLDHAIEAIQSGMEQHSDLIKRTSSELYDAAQAGHLTEFCTAHSDTCIDVAKALAAMAH